MTIDEALSEPDYIEDTVDAYRVLAAEVRRLRSAIEAVKVLPRFADMGNCMYGVQKDAQGEWIYREDVLDALEGQGK